MPTAEQVVRTYLAALKDPASLKDDDAIEHKQQQLADTDDPIERLKLQQELTTLERPSLEAVEDDFVVHAKSWADDIGIGSAAFAAEGVPTAVLRRAGFDVKGAGGSTRRTSGRRSSTRASSGKRVTTEEVIEAMPTGSFTVKRLREISGASPAVVRKAISAEQDAGRLTDLGPDPDHSGPGRAPTLYKKA